MISTPLAIPIVDPILQFPIFLTQFSNFQLLLTQWDHIVYVASMISVGRENESCMRSMRVRERERIHEICGERERVMVSSE